MEIKNESNNNNNNNNSNNNNSLSSSKKSVTEELSEKPKSNQEKDKSDTKSIKTTTEEDQNNEEIIDLPSPDEMNYEFLSKEQWEQEIELYRAYLLDLSSKKEPDIYRLTSEIATVGTLTFRLYKKNIKKYYFEAKFPFEDAFKLFGYTPFKQFHSLTSLYTKVIEFLIQDMRFKLREPILESSDKAVIQFLNNRIIPNTKCFFQLKKIMVKEKKMDEIIKSYLADIDNKLNSLKLQNKIFFLMNNGPKNKPEFYNYFKEPEELKKEAEIKLRMQKELEEKKKRKKN